MFIRAKTIAAILMFEDTLSISVVIGAQKKVGSIFA